MSGTPGALIAAGVPLAAGHHRRGHACAAHVRALGVVPLSWLGGAR